jgi:HEAT repeat protein
MFDHRRRKHLQSSGLCCLLFSLCLIADNGEAQAPPTIAQALRQSHIELTEPALIQALGSSDRGIRGLAASELAELKAQTALPDIVRAAEWEKDPLTQVNIAAAAVSLGSEEGMEILTNICANPAASASVRSAAARNVFDAQDHACFPALVEIMRSAENPDDRIGALSLASQIEFRTEQETQTVLALALLALADQDLRVRLQAGESLRWINDRRAIPALQKAISLEPEEAVRQEMKSALAFLQSTLLPANVATSQTTTTQPDQDPATKVSNIMDEILKRGEQQQGGVTISTWVPPTSEDLDNIRKIGRDAIAPLDKALDSRQPNRPLLAVQLLEVIGGADVVPPLERSLLPSNPNLVRIASLSALRSAPDELALPIIRGSVHDPDPVVADCATRLLTEYYLLPRDENRRPK